MQSGRKISRQRAWGALALDNAVSAASQADTAASRMQAALAATADKRATRSSVCPLEDPDAIPMWNFYKANRGLLITDVRLYREEIIASLRRGNSVEEAFRPYFKEVFVRPVEPDKAKAGVASRPAWPWDARPARGADGASAARHRSGHAAVRTPSGQVGTVGRVGQQPGSPRSAASGRSSS